MKTPESKLIAITCDKEITNLYKDFLEIIEDLQKDHSIMVEKIKEKHGEEYAENINYFKPVKYDQIRKRVLDHGNECNRSLLNFFGFFDSTINIERLNQREVVYKKTIISPPFRIE